MKKTSYSKPIVSKSNSKKDNRNHESIHHFQDRWATKLPWAESIIDETSNVN